MPAHLHELAKLTVVPAGHNHPAICNLKDLVGNHVRVGIAPAHRGLARCQIVAGHVGQHGHLNIEQGNIQMLALARAVFVCQRRQNRDGGMRTSEQVGNSDPRFLRPATGQTVALARDAHEAPHTLNNKVIARARRVRPGLTKPGDGAIHQARVQRLQAGVVQTITGELPHFVVFDQHVTLRHHLSYQGLTFWRGDVQCDRSLVAVNHEVVSGFVGILTIDVFD